MVELVRDAGYRRVGSVSSDSALKQTSSMGLRRCIDSVTSCLSSGHRVVDGDGIGAVGGFGRDSASRRFVVQTLESVKWKEEGGTPGAIYL